MSFIVKTDLHTAIKPEELTQITRGDDTIVYFGIDAAIAEITSYLSKYFDTDSIFAQTGNDRNKLLVNFAIDIAIYIIVSMALPGQDLEDRRARYKRAIDWLEKLAKNEISSSLPTIPGTNDNVNKRGSVKAHNKRNNYF